MMSTQIICCHYTTNFHYTRRIGVNVLPESCFFFTVSWNPETSDPKSQVVVWFEMEWDMRFRQIGRLKQLTKMSDLAKSDGWDVRSCLHMKKNANRGAAGRDVRETDHKSIGQNVCVLMWTLSELIQSVRNERIRMLCTNPCTRPQCAHVRIFANVHHIIMQRMLVFIVSSDTC